MKKVFNLSVILAVLVAAFTFSSCGKDKEDAAVITVKFDQGGTFGSGDNVTGTITSADEDLTKVTLFNEDGSARLNWTSFNALPILKGKDGAYTIVIPSLPDGKYSLQAFSKTGDSGKKDFTVGNSVVNPTETPLGAASNFSWVRDKGAAVTGLNSELGLAWTSNTATEAIIKSNTGVKLVELSASQWTSITTKEALKKAVDEGTVIADKRIPINKTSTQNVVLATKNGEAYHMIHITDAINFNYTGTSDYKYTISGQSKK